MAFGVATTMPRPAEGGDIPATSSRPPAVDDVVEGGEGGDHSSSVLRFVFFGLVLLAIPSALFLWCGGLQWARRVIRGRTVGVKGQYRMVRNEDLEK